jgi:hypothetical protein
MCFLIKIHFSDNRGNQGFERFSDRLCLSEIFAFGNSTRALKWIFPAGATLTIGGVFLYAQLERHSFENTQDLEFVILSQFFLPVLLLGSLLAIVGSFLDRLRLTVRQTRVRGIMCWLASAVSFLLLDSIGNVHGWTFAFIFPAFVGFIVGAVFLSKLRDQASVPKPRISA